MLLNCHSFNNSCMGCLQHVKVLLHLTIQYTGDCANVSLHSTTFKSASATTAECLKRSRYVDSQPSCSNTPVVPSADRGDNSCRAIQVIIVASQEPQIGVSHCKQSQEDRHWDTPISVNVRANVDIVVGVVRCDNPTFQVLMLEEIDEHLTAISECD
ncbi:hypothetical protein Tco_1271599 [Tanacetum coccineum]